MADALQIDSLMRESSKDSLHYKGINWLWAQDLQGAGYSNITQLQYDSQSVSNSGNYIVWNQAYLSIPYTITVQGTGLTETAGAAYFKAGFWHLVDSLQITTQNKSVNNLSTRSNMASTVRRILEWDLNKANSSAPTYGWSKDTAASNISGGAAGSVYTRNNTLGNLGTVANAQSAVLADAGYASLFPVLPAVGTTPPQNQGALDRARAQCFQAGTVYSNGQTDQTLTQAYRNRSSFAGTTQTITGIAIVPLRYLSDYFMKLDMPLKNLRHYLQVNVNQGQITFPSSGIGGISSSTFPFGTCPFQVSSEAMLKVFTQNAANLITASISIGTYNGSTTPTRMYYPAVQLDPMLDAKLSHPIQKTINYRDTQFYTLLNVAAGQNFNWQVSSAIPGLKRVFIVPMISANTLAGTVKAPSFCSAVASAPGTTDPGMSLTNISLQINTRQLYANNILYSYEDFTQQILSQRLNGDTTESIAGSLLPYSEWLQAYSFYVFDCSRVPSLEGTQPGAPVNLQVLATNSSAYAIDLYAFAEVDTSVVLEQLPSASYVK